VWRFALCPRFLLCVSTTVGRLAEGHRLVGMGDSTTDSAALRLYEENFITRMIAN